MIRMLLGELGEGSISVYLNAIEARVFLQHDVTIEYADTIKDDQAWHQFATIDHGEDVKKLVFQQLSES